MTQQVNHRWLSMLGEIKTELCIKLSEVPAAYELALLHSLYLCLSVYTLHTYLEHFKKWLFSHLGVQGFVFHLHLADGSCDIFNAFLCLVCILALTPFDVRADGLEARLSERFVIPRKLLAWSLIALDLCSEKRCQCVLHQVCFNVPLCSSLLGLSSKNGIFFFFSYPEHTVECVLLVLAWWISCLISELCVLMIPLFLCAVFATLYFSLCRDPAS